MPLPDAVFKLGYSSSTDSLLDDFYSPALTLSTKYDRAAGYFASSLLALAPLAFSTFVENGGRMRLICSPHLTADDAAFFRGENPSASTEDMAMETLHESLQALQMGNDLQQNLLRCLSSLIKTEVLQIKFAIPTHGTGLYHDKVGIFRDTSGNSMSFVGSANETASAWSGLANHEQFETFRDWTGPESSERCRRHTLEFEETWRGLRRGLRIVPMERANSVIMSACPPEPIDEVLKQIRTTGPSKSRQKVAKKLRPYQDLAIENWRAQDSRGIISFATGGGKTLTALKALSDWTQNHGSGLVLVPTELLHGQWVEEIKDVLSEDTRILLAGAGAPKRRWLEQLRNYTLPGTDLGPRVVVATYATAATMDFTRRAVQGDHILVIADEVHNVGATTYRQFLDSFDAGARLGLSATPERFGDQPGTDAIFRYFGPVVDPVFSIKDAIESRVLVPYEYEFSTCTFTDEETSSWQEITKRIGKSIARSGGEVSNHAFILLQQRARILKSAAAKSRVAAGIIERHHRHGDRWLVYCSDIAHIGEVREHLQPLNIPTVEYHSQVGEERAPSLNFFTEQGGIMLAVKCLDEGVDIPAVNKALILASSSNPREYIQRRGRVLRRSDGKNAAQIFDVLVVDEDGAALATGELKRAIEFASHSRSLASVFELKDLMHHTSEIRSIEDLDFDFDFEIEGETE